MKNTYKNNVEIIAYGKLKEKNKFIITISPEKNNIYIAWSNIEECEFHSDIFEKLEKDLKEIFPNEYRSGGLIKVQEKNNEKFVKFYGKSQAFGKYDDKVLKKHRKSILENLNFKNKKINLQIKTSS